MVITPGVKPGACRKAPNGKPFVCDVTIPGCGTSYMLAIAGTAQFHHVRDGDLRPLFVCCRGLGRRRPCGSSRLEFFMEWIAPDDRRGDVMEERRKTVRSANTPRATTKPQNRMLAKLFRLRRGAVTKIPTVEGVARLLTALGCCD